MPALIIHIPTACMDELMYRKDHMVALHSSKLLSEYFFQVAIQAVRFGTDDEDEATVYAMEWLRIGTWNPPPLQVPFFGPRLERALRDYMRKRLN